MDTSTQQKRFCLEAINNASSNTIRINGARTFLALSAFAAFPIAALEFFEGPARSLTSFGHRWLLTLFMFADGIPSAFNSLSYTERLVTEYFATWAAVLFLASVVLASTWHFMFDAKWSDAKKILYTKIANFEEAVLPDSLREAVQGLFRGSARPSEPFIALWRLMCLVWESPVGLVAVVGILVVLGFVLVIAVAGKFISAVVGIVVIGSIFGLLKLAWDAIRWDVTELPKVAGITLGLALGVVALFWFFAQLPPLLQMNAPALAVTVLVACICLAKGHFGFGSFDVTSDDLAATAEELLKNPKQSPTSVSRKTVIWS